MFGSKITETANGLYRSPINIRRELTSNLLLVAVVVLCALYFVRLNFFLLLIWIFVALVPASRRYRQFRRYGPMGPPSVSLANQALYIDRPDDSNGGVTIPLADLERIIVYGQDRRRSFRLIKRDKS